MSGSCEDQPILALLASEHESSDNPLTHKNETSVVRLEELRREILAGTYQLDADRLADAMLRSNSSVLGSIDIFTF